MTDFSQIENSIIEVKKRDGRVLNFQKDKISNAVYKALIACNRPDRSLADKLADGVMTKLLKQGFSAADPGSRS